MADEEKRVKIIFDQNAGKAATDVNKLKTSLDAAEKSTSKVDTAQKKAKKSSGDLGESFESLPGPIGNIVAGAKALVVQLFAIVANPIGLVLVVIAGALGLVLKAFTSTNDGADKLEQVLSGLSAVVDVLRDRFLKLLSLDFVGAFSGVGDEISKEFKDASNLAKALQEVADASRELGVSRAKLNRDLAESKELITDENASFAEKKKAIDNVRKAEERQTEQELANAKRKLAAIIQQNALSDSSNQDLQKQADAETAVFNLQREQSENKRSFNRLDKKADNEEKSRLKEITDAKTLAFKERLAKQKEANKLEVDEQKRQNDLLKALEKEKTDAELNLNKFLQDLSDKTEEQKLARQKQRAIQEIEILKQKGIDTSEITRLNDEKFTHLEIELANKRAEELLVVQQKAADKKLEEDKKAADKAIEIEKALEQAKKEVRATGLTNIESGLQSLKSLFGKNKAVQKGVLIAESAISTAKIIQNTLVANAKSVAAFPVTGGLPFTAINTASGALGIAANIAATAKGLQALGSGGGEAATGTIVNPNAGANRTITAPSVAFNNTAENQIGQSLGKAQANQAPIIVNVLESDVTKAQNNVQALVIKNSF